MQLIKIPTTSCVNATLKRWGHDFTRNREGSIQTIEPIGLIQMSMGEPIKLSTTLFVFLLRIIYLFQKLVRAVNALGMEEYGNQIRIGASHHF